jgi:hypothetical protein
VAARIKELLERQQLSRLTPTPLPGKAIIIDTVYFHLSSRAHKYVRGTAVIIDTWHFHSSSRAPVADGIPSRRTGHVWIALTMTFRMVLPLKLLDEKPS